MNDFIVTIEVAGRASQVTVKAIRVQYGDHFVTFWRYKKEAGGTLTSYPYKSYNKDKVVSVECDLVDE